MTTTATDPPHLTPVLGRYFQRIWSHGDGHRIFDTDGQAYLDFANGIAVSVLGHRHPGVNQAIRDQLDRLVGPVNALGFTEPISRAAEALASTFPDRLDTVMWLNSGSESIDAALKLARRVTGRPGIIAFENGFHGRTFGAMSVTSSALNYRVGYEPLVPSVYLTPFPAVYRDFAGDEDRAVETCLHELEILTATQIPPSAVAAIVIEPIQGEGGYYPAPSPFLRALRTFCDEHGIVLIADEIQTGLGRTGHMWAFEEAGVVPDVVCVAKGIANGLPLSAVVAPRDLHLRWGRGAHGSTFGGNPVACAAAVAVLETIEREGLVANAAARGVELRSALDRIAAEDDRIGDVRGQGLMVAVEFVKDRTTREPDGELPDRLIEACADRGLLVLTCGRIHQVVRWIPPLNVSAAEVNEGVEIFGDALASL
ncbi:MAG: aspartate aminotransferase family protein [Chloroflexota bacterium]